MKAQKKLLEYIHHSERERARASAAADFYEAEVQCLRKELHDAQLKASSKQQRQHDAEPGCLSFMCKSSCCLQDGRNKD